MAAPSSPRELTCPLYTGDNSRLVPPKVKLPDAPLPRLEPCPQVPPCSANPQPWCSTADVSIPTELDWVLPAKPWLTGCTIHAVLAPQMLLTTMCLSGTPVTIPMDSGGSISCHAVQHHSVRQSPTGHLRPWRYPKGARHRGSNALGTKTMSGR